MRKALFLLLLISVSLGIGKGIYFLKKGFSARRISHGIPVPVSDNFDSEILAILEQPFFFLGRGRQCYAFESKDGNYVLKFPRTDIYNTPFWMRALPLHTYRKNLEAIHKKRQQFILDSFKIAEKILPEQTGMIATHLGQSASTEKLIVIDAIGCVHHLPLGKTSFVLQKKHPLLTNFFLSALQNGDRRKAAFILSALLNVITERASKGVLNCDRSFLRNYGFDGQNAYQIDVGSFFQKEEMETKAVFEKSIRDSLDPIEEWLAKIDPEMLQYLNNQMEEILDGNHMKD